MKKPSSLSVGEVLTQGFDAVAFNPIGTLLPALLFGALPAAMIGYFIEGASADIELDLGILALSIIFSAITNMTVQGTLTRVVLAHLNGDDVPSRYSVRSGFRVAGALIGGGLVIGIISLVTSALLLLPGLMLYALWSVAAPVLVDERRGLTSALKRSAALVRPVFWRVMLLDALILVTYFVFWLILGLAGIWFQYGHSALVEDIPTPLPLGFYLLAALPVALASAVWGAVMVVLYSKLREHADGQPTTYLATIFS